MITQIYEIQTPEDAAACMELGVDHVGSVILRMDDWRLPSLKETVRLVQSSGAKSTLIPLFTDHDRIRAVMDYYRPDFIHLCDSLTDDEGNPAEVERYASFQLELKKEFPEVGIMRSIPVPGEDRIPGFPSLAIARILHDASDLFLIDTWVRDAPEEGYIGITGKLADRETARALVGASKRPVILAGGLSPENVYEAMMAIKPAGADSCTQTNVVTGEGDPVRFQKDFAKVRRFVEEVKRAEGRLREEKEALVRRLSRLGDELKDRETALPAHSVRPHQILAIEALEDEIETVRQELAAYAWV